MEYDFRAQTGQTYDSNYSKPASASSANPPYGKLTSLYPKIGGGGANSANLGVPGRNHQFPAPPSASGIGIRVSVKPEYRIAPPPRLATYVGEIPRSGFHYNFEFERILLAEAIKETPNWNRLGLETVPSMPVESTSYLQSPRPDPVVSKYIASGLNREAVPIAVANYGDNPAKVREFVNGYTLLKEMGFSSDSVADALFMYENDTDKALAHFLTGSS